MKPSFAVSEFIITCIYLHYNSFFIPKFLLSFVEYVSFLPLFYKTIQVLPLIFLKSILKSLFFPIE